MNNKESEFNPELNNDKKKRLIRKHLQNLFKAEPTLYYASTSDIARDLHQTIKEHINRMPPEEQALFKDLTVRDVEMLLSFH